MSTESAMLRSRRMIQMRTKEYPRRTQALNPARLPTTDNEPT
jgi:hypothetical protein